MTLKPAFSYFRQSSDVDLGRRYSTKANGRLLRRGADDKGLSLEADADGSPPEVAAWGLTSASGTAQPIDAVSFDGRLVFGSERPLRLVRGDVMSDVRRRAAF